MKGNRSELAPGRRSPQCHVNTRLDESTAEVRQTLLFWNDQNNALNASVKDSIAETFSCRMKLFSIARHSLKEFVLQFRSKTV